MRLKKVHASVDIGNHRYTYVQNCFLLNYASISLAEKSPRLPRLISRGDSGDL